MYVGVCLAPHKLANDGDLRGGLKQPQVQVMSERTCGGLDGMCVSVRVGGWLIPGRAGVHMPGWPTMRTSTTRW